MTWQKCTSYIKRKSAEFKVKKVSVPVDTVFITLQANLMAKGQGSVISFLTNQAT